MKGGKTKYKKTYNLKLEIYGGIFLLILNIFLVYKLLHSIDKLEIVTISQLFAIDNIEVVAILEIFSVEILVMIFSVIGIIIGRIKGEIKIARENKYIKNVNPYIYYRELPNDFGVGITSLLLDSTIENYKDVVAVILDLCAKKYLRLIKQDDKYIIDILKPVDGSLLSNEKYILSLITNNNIKNINYEEWYNYCMQDGVDLGLYSVRKTNNEPLYNERRLKRQKKIQILLSLTGGILISVLTFKGNYTRAAIYGIITFYLINLFIFSRNIGKIQKKARYNNMMENNFQKTEKGIEELHKLYSFKAFIKDFGNFVNKHPEEVVLWDRYLSYAQVFGLTKEIMNSGYKELIDNSAFQIDNIDNINFDNINIYLK